MLQLSLDYVSAEDRLLLRIGTDDKEARFWLTRKIVKALWPLLGEVSLKLVPGENLTTPVRHEASEMQRQAMVQQIDFSTRFGAGRQPIWGDGPVLASTIEVRNTAGGAFRIRFAAADGRSIELPFDAKLHAGLSELLRKAVSHSDWDVMLNMNAGDTGPSSAVVH